MTTKQRFSVIYFLIIALASAELFVSRFMNYVQIDRFPAMIHSVMAFAALALGNILYFCFPFFKQSLNRSIVFALVWMPLMTYLGGQGRVAGALLLASMLVPFGVISCHVFSRFNLRTIIIASGAAGISFFIFYAYCYGIWGRWFSSLTCAALILAFLALQESRRWVQVVTLAMFSILLLVDAKGYLNPQPKFTYSTILGGREKVAETIHGPLISTDLFVGTRISQGKRDQRYYVVTHGGRIAIVESPPRGGACYQVPYLFRSPKNVLVMGAAAGYNVEVALSHQAERVFAVDINPTVFKLLKDGPLSQVIDHVYRDPRVETIAMEGRHYLETTKDRFDLITLQGVQTDNPIAANAPPLIESFLYTAEAFKTMFNRLNDHGLIWIDEFRFRSASGGTLAQVLIDTFRQAFPDLDIKKHVIYLSYHASGARVDGRVRPEWGRDKEVLLISKSPLSEDELAVFQERIVDIKAKIDGFQINTISETPYSPTVVEDERPFLFAQTLSMPSILALLLVIFIFVAGILIVILGARRALPVGCEYERMQVLAMFFLGVGFVFAVAGMSMPAVLLTGHPEFATMILLATLYFSGALGGLTALRMHRRGLFVFGVALMVYLFSLPTLVRFLKPHLFGMEHQIVPLAFVVLMIALFGFLADVPYAFSMNSVDPSHRPKLITAENFGNVIGGLTVLLMGLLIGGLNFFWISGLGYGLCLITVLVMTTKKRSSA